MSNYNEEFITAVGRIVLAALENSGADMTQIYKKDGEQPDETIFKNISGQYAEIKNKEGGNNA